MEDSAINRTQGWRATASVHSEGQLRVPAGDQYQYSAWVEFAWSSLPWAALQTEHNP